MSKPENAVSEFSWREKISGFQKFILTISPVIGVLVFFIGLQMKIGNLENWFGIKISNADQLGGWLAGFGMFVAAQMFWGIKALFNYFEKRNAAILRKLGYIGLFWVLFVVAFVVDSLGFVSIVFVVSDYFM